jgi:hypothetical protein
MNELSYTPEVLAIVCPVCKAAVTGRCLLKTMWGSKYSATPHKERWDLAYPEKIKAVDLWGEEFPF